MFFGGKGGVGKTTCAAAYAVQAAAAVSHVLIVSTDPAHSLGDALQHRLTGRPSAVPLAPPARRRGVLEAVELDARRALGRWLAANASALSSAIEHGTWLDREDADALVGLPMPGVDELAGFVEIVALARQRSRDIVVIDTAPTGHMLRLVTAPDTVAAVAAVLDALQQEHRAIRAQFAGRVLPESADRLIATLADDASSTMGLLRDPVQTRFHWVTLPERMSVCESEDAIAALERAQIPVAALIVNRVTPSGPSCPVCNRRRDAEAAAIRSLGALGGRRREVYAVPALSPAPRGLDLLAKVARYFNNRSFRVLIAGSGRPTARAASAVPVLSGWRKGTPPERLRAFTGARLLLFGGKGGVGKTTCAAAVALRVASANPDDRVLLISTDPAHSLGDVLGVTVTDEPAPIPGASHRLMARELDAPAALRRKRQALERAIQEMGGAVGGAFDDRAIARELVDLAPPGIDELFGIVSVIESLAIDGGGAGGFDLVVVDTAPTGHALRLLEMPEAAREWIQSLLRMLLKYRSVVRPGQLAAELVDLSRSIRRLQAILQQPATTRFIVVTRAEALPRAGTERLIARLKSLAIAAPALIVNAMTLRPGGCPHCQGIARAEGRELKATLTVARRQQRPCDIILTPLSEPPPSGVAGLTAWASNWIEHDETRRASSRKRQD